MLKHLVPYGSNSLRLYGIPMNVNYLFKLCAYQKKGALLCYT